MTQRTWTTPPELWGKLKPFAREMRHAPTEAENRLWQALRRRQVAGLQFRRQHSIDRFIVDFYCSKAKLVVEVDGPIHRRSGEEDQIRQAFLESRGLHVLRFANDQVLMDPESVVDEIRVTLGQGSIS